MSDTIKNDERKNPLESSSKRITESLRVKPIVTESK